MAEVFAFAARIRAQEIYLEVRPSNPAARTFYGSLGFREIGRRISYYADGEDALVMVLPLQPSALVPVGAHG
jgi:ribosomal-protein-alanine N-acetyltransferase